MTETYDQYGGHESTWISPTRIHGCGKPCNHPDDHRCPWLNETTSDNKAIRCGCYHEPPPAKGRK